MNKKPESHKNSGTNLYSYLKNAGFLNVKLDAIFVSSNQFSDGIKLFLPMIYPYNMENLFDLKLVTYFYSFFFKLKRETQMERVKKDFKDRYVDKKFGEPKMNIMIFMACGEKEGGHVENRESFLDKEEL
jgi:hypothetical protein